MGGLVGMAIPRPCWFQSPALCRGCWSLLVVPDHNVAGCEAPGGPWASVGSLAGKAVSGLCGYEYGGTRFSVGLPVGESHS